MQSASRTQSKWPNTKFCQTLMSVPNLLSYLCIPNAWNMHFQTRGHCGADEARWNAITIWHNGKLICLQQNTKMYKRAQYWGCFKWHNFGSIQDHFRSASVLCSLVLFWLLFMLQFSPLWSHIAKRNFYTCDNSLVKFFHHLSAHPESYSRCYPYICWAFIFSKQTASLTSQGKQ